MRTKKRLDEIERKIEELINLKRTEALSNRGGRITKTAKQAKKERKLEDIAVAQASQCPGCGEYKRGIDAPGIWQTKRTLKDKREGLKYLYCCTCHTCGTEWETDLF